MYEPINSLILIWDRKSISLYKLLFNYQHQTKSLHPRSLARDLPTSFPWPPDSARVKVRLGHAPATAVVVLRSARGHARVCVVSMHMFLFKEEEIWHMDMHVGFIEGQKR
jgi:hypothetical protein